MYQLKNSEAINKMIYGFKLDDFTGGKMYIGGIPDEIIKNKYQGECKIKENEWGCDFEQIYFTEVNVSKPLYKYINNQKHRALFNSGIEGIAAPKKYMTFLSQTLFKELLEKKYCEIITLENFNRKQVIECKDKSKMMEYLPAYINFVFNGLVYIVSINKFVDSEMGNDNYNKIFLYMKVLFLMIIINGTLGVLFFIVLFLFSIMKVNQLDFILIFTFIFCTIVLP